MTKRMAKAHALKMWKWIKDHPGRGKSDFFEANPKEIDFYNSEVSSCALCAYREAIRLRNGGVIIDSCIDAGCPLSRNENGCLTFCYTDGEAYDRWMRSYVTLDTESVKKAAEEVYNAIKAW